MQKCYKYSHRRLIRDFRLTRMAHSNANKFFHPSHQQFSPLTNQLTELTTKIVHFKCIDGPASIHIISKSNENYFHFSSNWLILAVTLFIHEQRSQCCSIAMWKTNEIDIIIIIAITIVIQLLLFVKQITSFECNVRLSSHTQSYNQSTQMPKIRVK